MEGLKFHKDAFSLVMEIPKRTDCLSGFAKLNRPDWAVMLSGHIGHRALRRQLRLRDAWRKEGIQPKALRVIGWMPEPMSLMETVNRKVFNGFFND